MAQLARLINTGETTTTGTWPVSTGTKLADMVNETLSDRTVSVFLTPSTTTPSPHVYRGKVDVNWDGNALARPYVNTSMMLRLDFLSGTGAVTWVVKLFEGGSGTKDSGTLRDTWTIGSVNANGSVFNCKRYNVLSSAVDAITDFTALYIQIEVTVGTAGRTGQVTYFSLSMDNAAPNTRGVYSFDTAGQSAMPRSFEQFFGATVGDPVTVGSSRISVPNASALALLICYAMDFPADQYSTMTMATSFDNNKLWVGSVVRWNPVQTVFASNGDCYRYDMVTNVTPATHDLKLDGVTGVIIQTAAFATYPALVATDKYETRAVSTTLSGKKNGVQITTGTNSTQASGRCGTVLNPQGSTPWIGPTYIEYGSVPNVSPRFFPTTRRRGRGR